MWRHGDSWVTFCGIGYRISGHWCISRSVRLTSLVWAVDSTGHWSDRPKWIVPQSTSVATRTSIQWSSWPGRLTQAFSRPSPKTQIVASIKCYPYSDQISIHYANVDILFFSSQSIAPLLNQLSSIDASFSLRNSLPPHVRLCRPSQSAASLLVWCMYYA